LLNSQNSKKALEKCRLLFTKNTPKYKHSENVNSLEFKFKRPENR
jgi:hypothetical protein